MELQRFEPAMYSLEANQFLIEHAGEPPEIAFANGIPDKMARADIYPIIERLYRLEQECKHIGKEWAGVEAIKVSAKLYLTQHAKWEDAKKRGAPGNPSMYAWDALGRGHHYGIGSDSEIVRTYFDETGARRQLGVDLIPNGIGDYVPEWIRPSKAKIPEFMDLEEDEVNGVIKCPICQFAQVYEVGSSARRNMAKARVGRHLRTAKKEVDLHKQLYGYVFGGATVPSGGVA